MRLPIAMPTEQALCRLSKHRLHPLPEQTCHTVRSVVVASAYVRFMFVRCLAYSAVWSGASVHRQPGVSQTADRVSSLYRWRTRPAMIDDRPCLTPNRLNDGPTSG